MKSPFIFLAMFFLAFNIYGNENSEYLKIETDETYNFVENKKIYMEIKFKLSHNHNIYISPANNNSFSYFTKF